MSPISLESCSASRTGPAAARWAPMAGPVVSTAVGRRGAASVPGASASTAGLSLRNASVIDRVPAKTMRKDWPRASVDERTGEPGHQFDELGLAAGVGLGEQTVQVGLDGGLADAQRLGRLRHAA